MKKINQLVFTALFVFAVSPAFSQFSAGGDLAIPAGNLSNYATVGLGLSARYEAPIAAVKNLNWTASAGFITFIGKTYRTYVGNNPITGQPMYASSTTTSTVLPIVGGAKYYFMEANKGFYGALDLGLYVATGAYSSTYFGVGPGVGYKMNTWDFTARINAVSDVTFLGLRAAYVFGGK